jgi:ABC-type phosphate transport system substrate-binding protein
MQRFKMWMAGLIIGLALLAPVRAASAQGFQIVTNAAGPSAMTRDDVARVFLKKNTQLVAVDQEKDSRVRASFSKAILGRPLAAVLNYWQQQIFSGQDSPPAEKGSDADVLAFVRGNPRAIGYVSANADLGAGVKVVTTP